MTALDQAAQEFLSHKRIAIAGVSRHGDSAANFIYKRMRDAGYDVFAVNPSADMVEGDACYRSLRQLPSPVDGVVIATPPSATLGLMRECGALGVPRVWIHRSFGTGSMDEEAVHVAHELGISVIAGACPMMYLAPVDFGHKCMRWVLKVTGGLPNAAGYGADAIAAEHSTGFPHDAV